MDEATLLAHRDFWVQEARPHAAERLARLNEPEHALYDALRQGRHGERIRLEQERIAWDYAWPRTVAACEVGGSASGAFAGSR